MYIVVIDISDPILTNFDIIDSKSNLVACAKIHPIWAEITQYVHNNLEIGRTHLTNIVLLPYILYRTSLLWSYIKNFGDLTCQIG